MRWKRKTWMAVTACVMIILVAASWMTGCTGNGERGMSAVDGAQPAGAQAAGEQPAGVQPAGVQPAGAQAAGAQPAGEQTEGMQPTGVADVSDTAPEHPGTRVRQHPELTGEPIRIGAIYALSGNNAAIGTNILRGLDFAAEDINVAGGIGGRPIEIVRGDTQGDAEVARAEAERLIAKEQVHAIVGCHQSTLTEIVAEVCEEYRIPMITAISTVDSISTHDNEYFFRLCPMNSLYLENMFMYMQEQAEQTGKRVRTIAVFADNSMIGQEAIRCARIYAPRYGMEIVKEIQYRQGVADLTDEILELKEVDADAVLAESYVSDASLLMTTMQEQNYHPPILIAKANGFADPSFIPATRGISEGVTSVVEWNPDMTKGQDINKRFKEIFGVDMNGHSAEAYTAIWTFKTAFEQAGTDDGEAVKDALAAIDIQGEFAGGPEIILPYDRIKFEDHIFDGIRHYNDNIYASVAIAQIQDGEYKTVWPFEYSNQRIVYPAGEE